LYVPFQLSPPPAVTFIATLFGVALPVGYILGKRAARRYTSRWRRAMADLMYLRKLK
jgi:predicted MFS family arabinose efflux permease